MSRVSFFTTSSKEERHAWYDCAHTTASLNAISPSMGFLGTIRRNAMSPQNFSASPHACAWEGLRGLTESPVPLGIVSERDKCHGTPRTPEQSLPTGQDLWQNMHNCPFLIVSAIKENFVSWKAVVNKYLGEM